MIKLGDKVKILVNGTKNSSCWKKDDIVYIVKILERHYGCSRVKNGDLVSDGHIDRSHEGMTWVKVSSGKPVKPSIPEFNAKLYKAFIKACQSAPAVLVEMEGGESEVVKSDKIVLNPYSDTAVQLGDYVVKYSAFFSHQLKDLKTSTDYVFCLMAEKDDSDPPTIFTFLYKK